MEGEIESAAEASDLGEVAGTEEITGRLLLGIRDHEISCPLAAAFQSHRDGLRLHLRSQGAHRVLRQSRLQTCPGIREDIGADDHARDDAE